MCRHSAMRISALKGDFEFRTNAVHSACLASRVAEQGALFSEAAFVLPCLAQHALFRIMLSHKQALFLKELPFLDFICVFPGCVVIISFSKNNPRNIRIGDRPDGKWGCRILHKNVICVHVHCSVARAFVLSQQQVDALYFFLRQFFHQPACKAAQYKDSGFGLTALPTAFPLTANFI